MNNNLAIKNWQKFQHYKDRNPTWIKLHRSLIDDRNYFLLSAEGAKLLPLLWILSSENNGLLPDIGQLTFRLRTSEEKLIIILSELVKYEYLVAVSNDTDNKISLYQNDTEQNNVDTDLKLSCSLETEKETEKEKNKEKINKKENRQSKINYSDEFEIFWMTFPQNTGSKSETWRSYQKAVDGGATDEEIIRGATAYADYITATGKHAFVTQAFRWLDKQRWTANYAISASSLPGGISTERPMARYAKPSAADVGQAIIAKRQAARAEAAFTVGSSTAEEQSQSPGRAYYAPLPDLFVPGDIRRQGGDDGIP